VALGQSGFRATFRTNLESTHKHLAGNIPPMMEKAKSGKANTRPKKVLCVDDEAAGLEVRKAILERQGYSVVTATNAAQALAFFKAAQFDLVITDHLLGRTTATAMVAEMKRLNPRLPIIVLSGVVELPERMENVDAVISKADGPAVLLAKAEELLRGVKHKGLRLVGEPAAQVTADPERLQPLLAAIVESSDDAIFSKTLDGIITSWNKAAEKMYGYRAEEIIGKPVSILLPPDRPDEIRNILEGLKRGERIDHFETVRVAKDGHQLAVSVTISPIRDSSGRIVGASVIGRDITQRKMAEQAVRNSEKLAVAGRMAATVAHEINNPLEVVSNILYLLEQTSTWDETAHRFVRMAQEEVENLRQITKLTLGFHRQLDSQPSEVRIPELVDNVLTLFRRKIQSFGIAVETRYDSPGILHGVPAEFRQVLSNLLVNALDALQQTGNKLIIRVCDSVDWKNLSREGLRITIADDGSGIPQAARAHIFEPFYTTKAEEGTGMGLWVTRGIIEKYGGTVRFRSRTDLGRSGTTFSVFIPATSPS
jgi:PAS domain S-box-containing protein